MKSAKPSIRTSKRSRGKTSTAAPAFGDQSAIKEIRVDPTIAMDPVVDDTVDPTVSPSFSLHAMMEMFITTYVAHGQLINELLIEVATLRADFDEYRCAFPPPPPSDP